MKKPKVKCCGKTLIMELIKGDALFWGVECPICRTWHTKVKYDNNCNLVDVEATRRIKRQFGFT